jgi:hypothetical protein
MLGGAPLVRIIEGESRPGYDECERILAGVRQVKKASLMQEFYLRSWNQKHRVETDALQTLDDARR